ncbi:hypothetical protein TNCV_3953401 [Trichonephila clavipes]|nr:hypothetical protein TNCV_3953401 [Trichonephila clavipes]
MPYPKESPIYPILVANYCVVVSAADKGWRVYPLDPQPDAVSLYSGCTLGKCCARYLPDDRHSASLVGLRGGWRHARTKLYTLSYGSNAAVPGLVLPNQNIDANYSRFLILSLPNNEMSKPLPYKRLLKESVETRNQFESYIPVIY